MCVILFTSINGKKILAKNRDRIYHPNIEIIHEIIDGNEIVYIYDKKTGWIEGMNEHGNSLLNATLNMKDSNETSYINTRKHVLKKKKNKIFNALKHNTKKNIFSNLTNKSSDEKLTLEGNSLLHVNGEVYHLENDINNNFNIRNVKKPIVLTNHSNYIPHLGYTTGKKGLSSYLRQKLVETNLQKYNIKDNNNNQIYDDLMNNILNIYSPNIDPRLQPYRDEKLVKKTFPDLKKDNIIIYTTGQILCNVTDKEFVYYYDKHNSDKVKYVNKLPTTYLPKIRVIIKETEKNLQPQNVIPERQLKKLYHKFKFNNNFKSRKKKHKRSKLTKKNKT